MDHTRLDFELHRVKAIKDALLANDPDLDERTLADTVEGLTDLHDILAAIVRAALEDEADVQKLEKQAEEKIDRRDRFEDRANHRREIVRNAMLEAGINKLTVPDFTASLRNAPPHVVITNEAMIPEAFVELRPHIRKHEIMQALKDGLRIDGVELSNPGMSLTVRTK